MSVTRDGERSEASPRSSRETEPGRTGEQSGSGTSGAERDVEFPERFVEIPFDAADSLQQFTSRELLRNTRIDERGIDPESNSLRVTFREGNHYGTSLHYQFEEAGYPEPEELHARYYLRFANAFKLPRGGGKLPGPAGTYGRAGWGGRSADGANGWSARMYFHPSGDPERPIQLSNYVYHVEVNGPYGDVIEWDASAAGRIKPGKWYRIDNYVRLNTPGRYDGVLKAWVDGERALNVEGLVFREVPWLRINEYWFDCYWGGSWRSPADNFVYFDQLALYSNRRRPNE